MTVKVQCAGYTGSDGVKIECGAWYTKPGDTGGLKSWTVCPLCAHMTKKISKRMLTDMQAKEAEFDPRHP